jgi:hypothetical protein
VSIYLHFVNLLDEIVKNNNKEMRLQDCKEVGKR